MEEFENYFEYYYFNVDTILVILMFWYMFVIYFLYSFWRDIKIWKDIKKGNFRACLVLARNEREILVRRKRRSIIDWEKLRKKLLVREGLREILFMFWIFIMKIGL